MDQITIVGPTHPTKGGIAQHTDALIDRLIDAGRTVTVETWAAQYPKRLYPGQQNVADASEPRPRDATVHRSLRWFDPISWLRAGIRARMAATIVVAMVVPFQVVALAVIVIVGRFRRPDACVVVVAHNVLPHEGLPFDRFLVRVMMRLADRVITHTDDQGALASELGATSVVVTPLPPHLTPAGRRDRSGEAPTKRLVFFGLVREYKGVEDLIEALALVPDVEVSLHGECWLDPETLATLARERGVADRFVIDDRYVPDEELPTIFDGADALVLPYRTGTASQLVLIAHRLGVPVLATSVGSFPDQIEHDANGLLCQPSDSVALAAAIEQLYGTGRLDRLRRGAFDVEAPDHLWLPYLEALHHDR